MVKVKIKLLSRDSNGKENIVELESQFVNASTFPLLDLWEVERAINEHSKVRCHLDLVGDVGLK